jgi:hypothetical protein
MNKLIKALTGTILTAVTLVALAPITSASELPEDALTYGQNAYGLYYVSEHRENVYSKDLSCIGSENGSWVADQHCTYVSAHVDTSKAEKRREALRARIKMIMSAR